MADCGLRSILLANGRCTTDSSRSSSTRQQMAQTSQTSTTKYASQIIVVICPSRILLLKPYTPLTQGYFPQKNSPGAGQTSTQPGTIICPSTRPPHPAHPKNSRKHPPDPTHRRQQGQISRNSGFPTHFTRRNRRLDATTCRPTGQKVANSDPRSAGWRWSSRPSTGSNHVHFWPNPVQPACAFPSKGSPLNQPDGDEATGATGFRAKFLSTILTKKIYTFTRMLSA